MIYENKKQKIINDFKRKYCETLQISSKNSIKLWYPTGNKIGSQLSHEHCKMNICWDLWSNRIPFFTEFKLLNNVLRPDIVCFPNDRDIVFIEVRESETDDESNIKLVRFREKFRDSNLDGVKFLFIDVGTPFNAKNLL
jgi:hypothetical protein